MIAADGRITFDWYAVEPESRELSSELGAVLLQEKPFRVLMALLERPGRAVGRPELYDALWPADAYVDREAGLNTAIRKLRSALREVSGSDHDLLETLPRLGYRLRIDEIGFEPPAGLRPPPGALLEASSARGSAPRARAGSRLALIGLALGLSTLGFAAWKYAGPPPAGVETGEVSAPRTEPMPADPEQRARYIEARSLLYGPDEDLERAGELLRALTHEAPTFAPAHAYLAEAVTMSAFQGAAGDPDEARRAAHRALELDAGSAVAHRVLAMIALDFDWDLGTAYDRLQRALELDPSDPINHLAHAAYASAVGRHDEAIAAVRQAVDIEPDSMLLRSDAGYFLLRARRFTEAVRECETVLRLDAGNWFAHDCLLTAYSSSGDLAAARRHARYMLERSGASAEEIAEVAGADDPYRAFLTWRLEVLLEQPAPPAVQVAIHYVKLGDRDQGLRWLEVAARERAPWLIYVPQSPDFGPMREDPRYRQVLRSVGLEALAVDGEAQAG